MSDLISRQAAIDHLKKRLYETALNNDTEHPYYEEIADNRADIWMNEVPSAQPEIVLCKDCEYGEQDEVGRWFCRSLGCQIGNEDGSGYCADAERRTDG